eukprot:TRINITY_DN325_c0_g1_i1.p2 TRINITY_DN325_c0_g1~~TRINITY_DN325_c0_g1_i1.p2  ORF type:complete len:153 (+),score=0.27 TRINITY_DN325_c0_g1_i1:1767-2225(+)
MILEARHHSPLFLFWTLLRQLSSRFVDKRRAAAAYTHALPDELHNSLTSSLLESRLWRARMSATGEGVTEMEVTRGVFSFVVHVCPGNVVNCSCNVPKNLDYPCVHSLAALESLGRRPADFYAGGYTVVGMRNAYAGNIPAVPFDWYPLLFL